MGVEGRGSNKMKQVYWPRVIIKLDRRPLDEGPRLRRDKARCLLHDIILEGDTTLFLSNECGFPFGVMCCYNTFNDIIFFYQLSYIIFFCVHTYYLCYLDKNDTFSTIL
jgi:hypothetical protein